MEIFESSDLSFWEALGGFLAGVLCVLLARQKKKNQKDNFNF